MIKQPAIPQAQDPEEEYDEDVLRLAAKECGITADELCGALQRFAEAWHEQIIKAVKE